MGTSADSSLALSRMVLYQPMAYEPMICSREQARKWPRGSLVSCVICPFGEFGRVSPLRFLRKLLFKIPFVQVFLVAGTSLVSRRLR